MSFFILSDSNTTQNNNFEHIFWCYDLKRYTGYVLGVQELYRSTIAGFYALPAAYVAAFVPVIVNIRHIIFTGHQNQTDEMIQGDPHKIYVFKQASNYLIDQDWLNIMTDEYTDATSMNLKYKIT